MLSVGSRKKRRGSGTSGHLLSMEGLTVLSRTTESPTTAPKTRLPSILGGRYRVGQRLGAGAFGCVVKALDMVGHPSVSLTLGVPDSRLLVFRLNRRQKSKSPSRCASRVLWLKPAKRSSFCVQCCRLCQGQVALVSSLLAADIALAGGRSYRLRCSPDQERICSQPPPMCGDRAAVY